MRKRRIFCVILLVIGLFIAYMPKKPKIVSSVTSMDSVYLTILVEKRAAGNLEKLENKILQMLEEGDFSDRILQTEQEPVKNWYISVCAGKAALEKGEVCLTIVKKEGN